MSARFAFVSCTNDPTHMEENLSELATGTVFSCSEDPEGSFRFA